MTSYQLFAAFWPFVVLALFILFARILTKRDMAAYLRCKAAHDADTKQAAE